MDCRKKIYSIYNKPITAFLASQNLSPNPKSQVPKWFEGFWSLQKRKHLFVNGNVVREYFGTLLVPLNSDFRVTEIPE
jgi:hypothetical protein